MGLLRAGMTVEGRKPRQSPWTITGRPQWNTYASLDYKSAAKELNHHDDDIKSNAVLPPRRDMPFAPSVRLCKAMNKSTFARARVRYIFNQARVLSLRIDNEEIEPVLDKLLEQYNEHVYQLQHAPSKWYYRELIRLEAARGVVRAIRVS